MSLFDSWMHDLETRHLADLRFAEVSRALRALSSAYVERRGRLQEGAALTGAGKRSAFALFYGPLHYLTMREVVRALGTQSLIRGSLVDLGCGTGAAGVAWAETAPGPAVAIDRNAWALAEAARTYRHFGIAVRTRQGDITAVPWSAGPSAFLAAFAVNELGEAARNQLLERLLARSGRGDPILIVEPLARGVAPWWGAWRNAFEAAGGRADEWRFRVELPAIVAKLDRAAGLDHRELTARTLWMAAQSRS
jgi:SAM-dependent methyltransferase